MHSYQNEGVQFIKDHPFCALFVDLGLGKSVMSATAALDLIVEDEIKKVLIIGPSRVIQAGWPNEFSEWGHLCFYHMQVIAGTAKERLRALQTDCHFYTVSRDNIGWLVEHYKTKWPFDMVIIDESSNFKSHTSQRFKLLRRVRKYMTRLVELTATPAAEGYMGIFAQTYLLDGGDRFGQAITKYQENYFIQNRYNFKFKLRDGAEKEITRKISDICLVMKAVDYLDMGEPHFIRVPVPMDRETSDLYAVMEEESVMQVLPPDFDEYLDDPIVIEAEQAASLQAKLMQIASGFVYDTKIVGLTADDKVIKQKDCYRLHELKLDALEELMNNELADKNVLIAYHFQSTLERFQSQFPKAVLMDKEGKCIKKWNDGKIKMLAAHPQSAGYGLNLQRGGHVIVYLDHPWSLEQFLQFNGRIHRQGQKEPVRIYQLCATLTTPNGSQAETVDDTVIKALRDKEDVQDAFFELLERLRGKYAKKRKTKKSVIWDDEED